MNLLITLFLFMPARASIPVDAISEKMAKIIEPLESQEGFRKFVQEHSQEFFEVSETNALPQPPVEDYIIKIGAESYRLGMGFRSIYILATPKIVVSIVDDPQYFQALYGLDKPADIFQRRPDGTFDGLVFKLVPGVETQEYILHYSSHWEDSAWIQRAKQIKDERNFAIRDNIKYLFPQGTGTVFREVSLLYPLRWWARLFPSKVRSVTSHELAKLNAAIKCAAEKVQLGSTMSVEIAATCHKEANK